MSARLGEMLLKIGALTEAELEQVLNAQSIYGGRLGTNLVEMGLVAEDELARTLSEQLGVPFVDSAMLDGVPEALLSIVPHSVVERYRVLPIAVDGRRLTVAMADPSAFRAMEEIGFSTGLIVIPRVCSELRLSLALERYYGIKRPVRYIPVEGGVRSAFAASVAGTACDTVGASAWSALGEEIPLPERLSVKELAVMLAGASDESEVVQALLSYLAGEFDRGAFLRLKGEAALGVKAVEAGMPVVEFPRFIAAIPDTRQLKRVVQEKTVFLGELGGEGPDVALIRAMGGEVPAPVLLVPLTLGGKVAAVICANDRRGRLGGGAFDLQRVAVMAELSLEMLSMRKRILAE